MLRLVPISLIVSLLLSIGNAGGWKNQEKGVWFPHIWDNVPIEVKTTSTIGSNDSIMFHVAHLNSGRGFARVVVRLSDTPIFYILYCQRDTKLQDLPDAQNDVRIWTFVKEGFKGISIKCNGVLVAEMDFAESRQAECSSSEWMTSTVRFIEFNPDWDKSVGIRDSCSEGSYRNSNMTECARCEGNTFSSIKGAGICSPCPDGTVVNKQNTLCDLCLEGSYRNSNMTECARCEDYTFSSIKGAGICSPCPDGTVVNKQNTLCGITGGDKIILPVAYCGVAGMLLGIMIIVAARKFLLRKCLCRNVEMETEADYINAETVQLQSMLPPLPSHVPPIPLCKLQGQLLQ